MAVQQRVPYSFSMTRRAQFAIAFTLLIAGFPRAVLAQALPDAPSSRRAAAAEAKVAQDADWGIVRMEPASLKLARTDPNALLAGITLSTSERSSVNAIKRQYTLDLNEMGSDRRTADGAGEPNGLFVARLDSRRARLRSDVRDALSAQKQLRLDRRVLGRIQ
jgi:hypothetical protein